MMVEIRIDVDKALLERVMDWVVATNLANYTPELGRIVLGGIIETALERWLETL